MHAGLFGTNGMCGVINEDFTADVVLQLGKAIGLFMKGQVAIATDTRSSADMVKTAISAGLMSVGCKVLDLGVIPTPALQYFVKSHEYISGGVMITASHNPPEYSGVKCISSDGIELSAEDEKELKKSYADKIPCNAWSTIGSLDIVKGASYSYIEAILSHVDVNAIRNANLKAVVDCMNGTSCMTIPFLMKALNINTVTLNANPRGEFTGHPNELIEENLKSLIALTKSEKADFGVAQDSDADRAVFITEKGKFVSGDKCLALLAKREITRKKGGIVVTGSSSSLMVRDAVSENGGDIRYTLSDSRAIARKMMETKAIFGGEENGGVIYPEHMYCADGAMLLAKMIESIVLVAPLQKQINELPIYYFYEKKMQCTSEKATKAIQYLMAINNSHEMDAVDGLKIIFDDGQITVRLSDVESVLSLKSESKDETTATERGEEFEKEIRRFLTS